MLVEDLHLGLMPIRGSRPRGYQVTLAPSNQESIEEICFGLPSFHGDPREPMEAVEDFVNYVAQIIGYDGEAFFEIVYFYEKEDQPPRRFRLEHIPRETLHRRIGGYIQKGFFRDTYSATKKDFKIEIPRDYVAHFEVPHNLGGPERHRQVLEKLIRLSDVSMTPKFAEPTGGHEIWPTYFDFSRYNSLHHSEVFRVTRHWGWIARQYDNPHTTEFFSVYRFLRFELTKAYLREEILRILNQTLGSIGTTMPPVIRVEVTGLPSSSEIQAIISQLAGGSIGFKEAINFTKSEPSEV
jgi:hypothetical protein